MADANATSTHKNSEKFFMLDRFEAKAKLLLKLGLVRSGCLEVLDATGFSHASIQAFVFWPL